MKKLSLIAVLLCMTAASMNAQETESSERYSSYFGQKPPGLEPVKLLPEILTSEKHPHGQLAFSPDGKLALWSAMLADGPEQTIFFSTYNGQNISRPEIAPFAYQSGNGGPTFMPDGNRLFFSAQLPTEKNSARHPSAIYYVDKTETGWTSPVIINATVDTLMTKGQVSVARNGNIYFSGRILTEQAPNIYICRHSNGEYQKPEKITGPLSTIMLLVDPWIDPDEKFMLFSFPPEEGSLIVTDIGISFPDKKGEWSRPVRLNKKINTEVFERFPSLSGDGKYLFFIRSYSRQFVSDQAHFYWVSVKNIEELKPKD